MKRHLVGLIGAMTILLIAVAVQEWRHPVALAQGQGSAPVTVVNTPLPVTVANTPVAGEPFQASICDASGDLSCGNTPDTVTVPATHRATIEAVTATCQLLDTSDTLLAISLVTTVGNENVIHYLGVTPVWPPTPGSNRYTQAQQTRIHADPGTDVTMGLNVFGLEGRRCFGSISGVLTPVS